MALSSHDVFCGDLPRRNYLGDIARTSAIVTVSNGCIKNNNRSGYERTSKTRSHVRVNFKDNIWKMAARATANSGLSANFSCYSASDSARSGAIRRILQLLLPRTTLDTEE